MGFEIQDPVRFHLVRHNRERHHEDLEPQPHGGHTGPSKLKIVTLSPLTAIRDIEQLARTLLEGVADFATLPRRAELLSPLSPAHGRLLMDVIYHKLALVPTTRNNRTPVAVQRRPLGNSAHFGSLTAFPITINSRCPAEIFRLVRRTQKTWPSCAGSAR